ncbi:MAG TPA: autotransporter domain-containing protein [Methyloceanibacter sp.]|nr:autotransporter domain-containing protein [Methyloceanibacter sp.]
MLAENGNYKPRTEYDGGTGNDVVLILSRSIGPDGPISFCDVAVTFNQCSVAHALDRFPTDNALFLAVLNQTEAGARQAFDALSGEIHATLPGVLADDARYVRDAVMGRLVQASYTNNAGQLAALGAGGPQVASLNTGSIDAQAMPLGYDGRHLAAPPPRSGAAFWTRGYGAWGDFKGDGNAASADRDLGGFISGIDTQISGTWRAGLAAGGSWSNISVGDRHSHAEVESFQLAGYAGGMAGPLALRGGGAWAWQDIDTDRAVMFPGFFERQSTSYDADTGQIFGEVAYPVAAGRFAVERACLYQRRDRLVPRARRRSCLSQRRQRRRGCRLFDPGLARRHRPALEHDAGDPESLRRVAACLRRRDARGLARLRHHRHRLRHRRRAAGAGQPARRSRARLQYQRHRHARRVLLGPVRLRRDRQRRQGPPHLAVLTPHRGVTPAEAGVQFSLCASRTGYRLSPV